MTARKKPPKGAAKKTSVRARTAKPAAARRGKATAAPMEGAEKYKFLIEATNTAYVILDDQGRVLEANQEYVRMTGHSRLEEILGRAITEWTAPYDLGRNAVEVKKCMETGSVRDLVIDYIGPTGRVTPVEINATVLRGSGPPRIFTVCRDITDRKKAEQELIYSEEKFRKAFSTSPDSININRLADGMYVSINKGFTQITGYSDQDVIGRV
jgi:PAS domain S-box-containing protein